MIITIHQPQYLPWLGYFDKIARADVFVLLDNVQFKKNEWQNRNRIRTPDGWQWITVPVVHDFGSHINQIKLNNTLAWPQKHLRSIELNYAKALFFKEYFPLVEGILNRRWDNLAEVNIAFVRAIVGWLGIKTKIVLSSQYESTPHATMRLVDLCQHFKGTTYLSGEGGENYLDFEQFKRHRIKVAIQKYQHPVYPQLWGKDQEGFISHLSVLDLIFNCGPKSLSYLLGERTLP